jgi:spore germination cell wall hydrolase CwlJ-like protein
MKKLLPLILASVTRAACLAQGVEDYSTDEIVAATMILEAGGEKSPGALLGVYEVIRNRAERTSTCMKDVVFKRKQFSCWNNQLKIGVLLKTAMSHPRYEEALRIVKRGNTAKTDAVFGATHYHATSVKPHWITSSKMKYLVTIGNHHFYREVV